MTGAKDPRQWRFEPDGAMPNNPQFPVLLYQHALPENDPAGALERLFSAHGWKGTWRNGVFRYHHYHSGAHEVLGVARGSAELLIGGEGGARLSVRAGDILVLPAGTGHKNLGNSDDFLIVGAYPPGQHAEIETGPAGEAERRRIAQLPLPQTDPVEGRTGPLLRLWRADTSQLEDGRS